MKRTQVSDHSPAPHRWAPRQQAISMRLSCVTGQAASPATRAGGGARLISLSHFLFVDDTGYEHANLHGIAACAGGS